MATPGKRAFWLHQGAEYIIGVAFLAQGLQSPTPAVPTVMGALVVLNTACAKGPLSAFRVFGRRVHRVLDVVIDLLILVATVQPFIEIESATRLVMGLLAFVLLFIWFQSDFAMTPKELRRAAIARGEAPPPAARADGTIPDTIGRSAGRLAGQGVNVYRARKAQRANRDSSPGSGSDASSSAGSGKAGSSAGATLGKLAGRLKR